MNFIKYIFWIVRGCETKMSGNFGNKCVCGNYAGYGIIILDFFNILIALRKYQLLRVVHID